MTGSLLPLLKLERAKMTSFLGLLGELRLSAVRISPQREQFQELFKNFAELFLKDINFEELVDHRDFV